MTYKVYRITLDGKEVYIGYTSMLLHKRFGAHCSRAKLGTSPMLICRAINKYGRERFNIELIKSYDSKAEAIAKEIDLIAERKPRYNIHIGGTGGSRPGSQNGMFGKKHAPSWCEQRSAAMKGVNNHMFCSTHSISTRERIAESRRGSKMSEETKRKISETNKARWAERKSYNG